MARFIDSNTSREPTYIPSIRILFMTIGRGFIVPAVPVKTPIKLIRPPVRTALMDCVRVPAPPTSTT